MRTNELHAHAKQVKRSSGRSSVGAAAYRSASRLVDERTGEVHDYTQKHGVEHSRIYAPDNAPDWARDREALWNAVEVKENRSNSCTAHELEVSFPHEFNAMQRREAGDKIAKEIMRRYGGAVDIGYHVPTGRDDERNFHAHILFTTRGFDETTKDGWSKTKFRELSKDPMAFDKAGNPVRDLDDKVITRGRMEIADLRHFTAHEMNRIAERDNLHVRTEHLSFEQRGVDREPTYHLGPVAHKMEQQGKPSRIGDENRAIANDNRQAALDMALKAKESTLEKISEVDRNIVQAAQDLANLDLSQRHHREKMLLEAKLEKTYGTTKATVKAEVDSINQRLQAKGVRKILRHVFGSTRSDKETRRQMMASLADIEKREKEARGALERRQSAERTKQARKQNVRREQYVAERREARETGRLSKLTKKPAQTKVKQRTSNVTPDLKRSVTPENKPLNEPDLATKKTTGSEKLDRVKDGVKRPWESNAFSNENKRPWESDLVKRDKKPSRAPSPSPGGSNGGSGGKS